MKSIAELLNNEPVYIGDWSTKEGLMYEFDIINEWLEGINILFAYYEYICYEGDAFVLFEKDGFLYEVNGSHCSCYGLEGQWQPEEASLLELEHRLTKGTFGAGFRHDLCEFLGIEI